MWVLGQARGRTEQPVGNTACPQPKAKAVKRGRAPACSLALGEESDCSEEKGDELDSLQSMRERMGQTEQGYRAWLIGSVFSCSFAVYSACMS